MESFPSDYGAEVEGYRCEGGGWRKVGGEVWNMGSIKVEVFEKYEYEDVSVSERGEIA